ncbi:MAG: hypothetical protein IT423_00485, partial [Pirellulaceae bacterium]|nr:hypothetical protein [Pirellulaceae bacterium]
MDRTVTAHRVLCLLAWIGLHGELAEHLSADDQPTEPVVSQVAPQTKDQSSAQTKPAAADQPDSAAIGDWIRELGAQEFATRRRAFMQLWQQGSAALPALREASTISDRQTASAVRVLELLLKLEISPTDNDELAELMQLSGGNLYRALMSLTSKGHWRLAAELLRSNQAMVVAVREKIRPDEWCQIIQSA